MLADSGCELSSSVVSLLYQVVEWSLLHQDTIPLAPSVLSRLTSWLATLAHKRKETASRVGCTNMEYFIGLKILSTWGKSSGIKEVNP